MAKIYRCINSLPHTQHTYNRVFVFDKINDQVLLSYSKLPHFTTKEEMPASEAEVAEAINTANTELVDRLTDNNPANLGYIYICDSSVDSVDVVNFCVENGDLVKQHKLILECDAEDTDMDGIPDIEGDGISVANFTLKITDFDTGEVISDFNGVSKITTERGKILGGPSGMIDIVNGMGSFQLRSVGESVNRIKVTGFFTKDRLAPSIRVQPGSLRISFR